MTNEEPDPDSIFAGVPEEPEEGAHTMEESVIPTGDDPTKGVTDDGNLKMQVPLGDIDPFDHGAAQDAVREQQRENGTAPPDMPVAEPLPVRNPAMSMDASEPLQEEMERRFSQEYGDITVKVDVTERDAFVRSATLDEEFVLVIEIDGVDMTVTVAIPPDEFTNSAAAAVNHWANEDFIDKDSDLQWLLAFQQVHVWYQVRAINGEPTPWSDYWSDGMPPNKQLRADMRDTDNFDVFFQMNAVRWRMMLDAVRTAELKYKICQENWQDRSFFGGADTD